MPTIVRLRSIIAWTPQTADSARLELEGTPASDRSVTSSILWPGNVEK